MSTRIVQITASDDNGKERFRSRLIVNLPPYRGRFHQEAVDRVKSGERVGQVVIHDDDGPWLCHVCGSENDKPVMEDGYDDAFVPCKCGMMFIVRKI